MIPNNTPAYLILFFLCVTLLSCSDEDTKTPKPRMFPKVVYPAKNYTTLDTTLCNFSFKMADYSTIVRDSFAFQNEPAHPCWFDIKTPSLNVSLHCSYYEITKQKDLSSLINDAFFIAGKHNIKANYRKETVINTPNGVKGIVFDIDGPVASPVQFYLTDDKKHFFRASLYFNSKVNPDSTAPVLSFIKNDIDTLIASFRWKN